MKRTEIIQIVGITTLLLYTLVFVGVQKVYMVGVMLLTTIIPFVEVIKSDLDYMASFAVILILVNIFCNMLKKLLFLKRT